MQQIYWYLLNNFDFTLTKLYYSWILEIVHYLYIMSYYNLQTFYTTQILQDGNNFENINIVSISKVGSHFVPVKYFNLSNHYFFAGF